MNAVLADARRGHRGLYWFAIGCVGLTVVLAGLAAVDHRELLGAPLWFKPLKFAISFAAYAGALAWLLGQLRVPAMRWTGWSVVVASAVELVLITGQAARGVRSHFNDDTPFDESVYIAMGATVAVIYLATAAVALRLLRERGLDAAMAAAVRIGLAVALAGMSVGIVIAVNGAHTVGLADGGPGLPLLGWSTTAGDLRIGHFVGMHAMQVLPLLAALLPRTVNRLAVVRIAGAGYLGVTVLVTVQALRGLPLLAPDALTTGLALALALGMALALHRTHRRVAA